MSVITVPGPADASLADLLRHLGGIPAHRVRLFPSPGTATEADFARVAATERTYELIDGTLVEKPMGLPEAYLGSLINMYLAVFATAHRLGIVVQSDGAFRMSKGNLRLPDVSFTRRDRLQGPLPQVGGWCPDLCVEVLSPDNTPAEMARKRAEYFGSGCRLVWEIDPRKRTAVAYRAGDAGTPLAEAGVLDGDDALPGFSLSLPDLFAAYDEGTRPAP